MSMSKIQRVASLGTQKSECRICCLLELTDLRLMPKMHDRLLFIVSAQLQSANQLPERGIEISISQSLHGWTDRFLYLNFTTLADVYPLHMCDTKFWIISEEYVIYPGG